MVTKSATVDRASGALLRMDQQLLDRLSPTDRQVLAGLVDGRSDSEISQSTGISSATVRAARTRIEVLHEELFGPLATTQSTSTVAQSNTYELPTNAVELAGYLKTQLGSETRLVSDAITIAIEDSLSQILSAWLGEFNSRTDLTHLRKLANSVSSLGTVGIDRTREALEEIARWDSSDHKLSKEQALQILRDETADYRKAKSFLANQAKCVIAFPKFFLEHESDFSKEERVVLEGKVESAAEYKAWVTTLGQAWVRAARIKDAKNHKLYLSQWHLFTLTVITDGSNAYSTVLVGEVDRILKGNNHKESFIRSLGKSSTATRNVVNPRMALKSSLKVEGDHIAVHAQIDSTSDKLNQIKEDVIFMCAQDSLLKKLSLEVSIDEGAASTLIVRFIPPKEHTNYRRAIDAINKHIKASYQSM